MPDALPLRRVQKFQLVPIVSEYDGDGHLRGESPASVNITLYWPYEVNGQLPALAQQVEEQLNQPAVGG